MPAYVVASIEVTDREGYQAVIGLRHAASDGTMVIAAGAEPRAS